MANGFRDRAQGYIAYQAEEHGLAHQVAKDLRKRIEEESSGKDSRRSSPRQTSADTLSALLGRDASLGVVPLQNDIGGYDKRTLEALIDFNGYGIIGAEEADDHYVLAVPKSQVFELGESNFPSAFTGRSVAVGNLPKDEATRNMLRKRIDRVYASADAIDRCAAALAGFRAEGIEISHVPDGENPYRMVLKQAERNLDPDRIIRTTLLDGANSVERTSHSTGKNYSKGLTGVLIPAKEAGFGKDPTDAEGEPVYDYVIVDERLVGNRDIRTRFLYMDKTPEPRPSGKALSYTLLTNMWKNIIKQSFAPWELPNLPDNHPQKADVERKKAERKAFFKDRVPTPFKFSRVLFKLNSRGEKTADTGIFENRLLRRGFKFTPVVLNDRPDDLPIVYEIEVENDPARLKSLMNLLHDARDHQRGWRPKFLGAYGTDQTMDVVMPKAESAWTDILGWVLVPLLLLLGLAAAWFLFGAMTGDDNDNASAPVIVPPTVVTAPVVAACGDADAPLPARFEVVRSAPDTYWLCGNSDLVTDDLVDAVCEGNVSPADYAAMTKTAIPVEEHLARLVRNDDVAASLCDADMLIVAGSASSSPFEKNTILPEDRATSLASALTSTLQDACLYPPEVQPLSLGVADCADAMKVDGICQPSSDLPADRQILLIAANSVDGAALTRTQVEDAMSAWLGTYNDVTGSAHMLGRLTDPSGFDVNQLVWAKDAKAARISVLTANEAADGEKACDL